MALPVLQLASDNFRGQNLVMVDAAGWVHVWSWVSERLIFSERVGDNAGQIFSVACNNDGCPSRLPWVGRLFLSCHDWFVVQLSQLWCGKEASLASLKLLHTWIILVI